MIEKEPFGRTREGKEVSLYRLVNKAKASIEIITYGGTVLSISVPNKSGNFSNVVGRLDSIADYERHDFYFGSLVGRVANRIGGASFPLNGKTYTLAATTGPDTLHGGVHGFNSKVWNASKSGDRLVLTCVSPDGEEGFPGTMNVTVTYTLTDENALVIDYIATTDADSVVNLTNHTYFNLAGSGDILNHELTLYAEHYTPTTPASIPTGEIAPVTGTPLDFTKPRRVGERIDEPFDQLVWAGGYDQNLALSNKPDADGLRLAAILCDPVSGRVMTMRTTEPGVQFYTGNYLNGAFSHAGVPITKRSFLCLEAQHYPNAVNIPSFPSMLLRPGQTYRQTTEYKFSVI